MPAFIPNALDWVSVHETPFASEGALTGIYLVRDTQTKQMTCINLQGPLWTSPITFNEYAYIGAMPLGFELQR